MCIILFTHFQLSIRFLPFPCYDWKSRIFHICTIKSLGSQKSVKKRKVFQIIAIWLEPVLKKSRYFELFVDTSKVGENLLNDFNIEPWTYNSSKSL